MSDRDYPCPFCDGSGEIICGSCGTEVTCSVCQGAGLDTGLIDVKAWTAAEDAFGARHGTSWDWERGGKTVGREAEGGARLAYADFLIHPAAGAIPCPTPS